VAFRFKPVDTAFYTLLTQQAVHLVNGAGLVAELLDEGGDRKDLSKRMRDAEHEADETTHEVVRRVNSTFVTPFDREDIIALASAMDNIVDFIEEIADFLGLFRIEAPTDQAQRMGRVLHEATRHVNDAMPALRRLEDIRTFMLEVNRLESEGDRILREAVATLFDHGIDPMMVIRWKDIYERLEDAIDATEAAMNIMSGIIIKNR